MDTIKIDDKIIKSGRIINNYFGKGKVIATVFGLKNEVKRDLKIYMKKGYKFIYFVVNKIHVVRVIDPNKGK